MKELKTEINISAPKEKVWDILTDFERYPRWNPFIKSIKGTLKVRQRLEVQVQPPDSGVFKFKPKVTSFKHQQEFSWLGSLLMYGIFDGRHIFEIEENSDGSTTLIHREEFSGILVPFMWKQLNTKTRDGFELMNEALKKLAENESH